MIKTVKKIDLQGNEVWQEVCVCNRCKKTLEPTDFIYETKWTGWHCVKMEPGVAYGFGQGSNPIKHICEDCQKEVESFLNGNDLKVQHSNPAYLLKTDQLIALYDYDGTPECVRKQILEELADRA